MLKCPSGMRCITQARVYSDALYQASAVVCKVVYKVVYTSTLSRTRRPDARQSELPPVIALRFVWNQKIDGRAVPSDESQSLAVGETELSREYWRAYRAHEQSCSPVQPGFKGLTRELESQRGTFPNVSRRHALLLVVPRESVCELDIMTSASLFRSAELWPYPCTSCATAGSTPHLVVATVVYLWHQCGSGQHTYSSALCCAEQDASTH